MTYAVGNRPGTSLDQGRRIAKSSVESERGARNSRGGAGNSQGGAGNSQGGAGNSKICWRGSFQNGELPYAPRVSFITLEVQKYPKNDTNLNCLICVCPVCPATSCLQASLNIGLTKIPFRIIKIENFFSCSKAFT